MEMCSINHIQQKELITIKVNIEALNKSIEAGEKKLYKILKQKKCQK